MNYTRVTVLLSLIPLLHGYSQTNTPATPPSSSSSSSLTIMNERTDEERIQFLLDVAQSYIAEKNFKAAINAYERILIIDPSNKQTRYVVAHIYINAKQYKKAEVALLELISESPEDFQLWNNLAWLYATAEDPGIRDGRKAVKCAHEAMSLAPNDHHVWSTLSEAYYVSGQYEKSYRAINHMAKLASLYAKDLSKESVDEYNEQIRKCKRAMDTAESMKALNESE
jgi:tetratricopeptide (TPR) repeat protein